MRPDRYNGFTLLEFIIYILFFSFIAMATASWAVHLVHALRVRHAKQELLSMFHAAHDLLLQDIHHAPTERGQWKEIQPTCLIWTTHQKEIGWQWECKQLFRIEGRYNVTKKQWSHRTKNLVAAPVDMIQFTHVGKTEIKQIVFSITSDNTTVTGIASPLRRKLLWNEKIEDRAVSW